MKTAWDYSTLADAYLKRPDYSSAAIDAMLRVSAVDEGAAVCDVGAGVAHLTLMLAERRYRVQAVEPNDNMRANGLKRTAAFENVTWSEGVGEATGQPASTFDLVTFGSSFNVCDRRAALVEAARILKPKGWFACMWNHRDLKDPIQERIEDTIRRHIPTYGYGTRREDQTQIIGESCLFGPTVRIAGDIHHKQSKEDCVEAWKSHATLERQAKELFLPIVHDIEHFLNELPNATISIPYTTHIWMAQKL